MPGDPRIPHALIFADRLVAELLAVAFERTTHCIGCAADDPRGSVLLIRPGCPEPDRLRDTLRWDDPTATAPEVPAPKLRYLSLIDDH